MASLISWLNSTKPNFKTGVTLYNKFKISNKHDAFFATTTPTPLHFKMLRAQLLKLHAKNTPERVKNDHSKKPAKAPLVKAINIDDLSNDQDGPNNNVMLIRKSKELTNKFLTMEYSMLSPGEKNVFFNDENYFNTKKSLLQTNGDIEQQMRSIHTNMKSASADSRPALIKELAELDDTRAENFIIIDGWTQDNITKAIPTKEDPTTLNTLELDKRFRVNKSYICRAEKMLPNMKVSTAKQREKKEKKKAEIDKRTEENKLIASTLENAK